MNKIKPILALSVVLLATVSCENKLDLIPKGKTTLRKLANL